MIVHASPFPAITIPRQTVGACVFAGFAGREDAPVLIDGASERTLTGRDLMAAPAASRAALPVAALAPAGWWR